MADDMTEIHLMTGNIVGREIKFLDDRSVFVGRRAEPDDFTYIQFRNGEDIRRLRLSHAAADALRVLLSGEGGEEKIFPTADRDGEFVWRVARDVEAWK